jgi:murein DD-endopeptidase MepM/ murein hydrolase activator NlpD
VISYQLSAISYQKLCMKFRTHAVPTCLLMTVLCLLITGCTLLRSPPVQGLPHKGAIAPGKEIIAGRNQNVYGLAHKHNVSMRELIVLNDLQAPFTLREGQHITLPANTTDMAPSPSAAPSGAIEQAPLESSLAPSSSTITSTPLEAPQTLPPTTSNAPTTILPPPAPAKPVSTTVMASNAKTASLAPPKPAEPAPVPKTDTVFAWPVQGPILSAYGAKAQGTNNDGIDISAPKGSPVTAAAGGIVVYAGNDMKGFGNLVFIRHEGGWVTAYAHLDRMMVARDTVVAPGDMIGTVGSTGGVSSPQLHFETRLEGKAIDPQTVIKKS